jgi:phospholipase/carboxylesterase
MDSGAVSAWGEPSAAGVEIMKPVGLSAFAGDFDKKPDLPPPDLAPPAAPPPSAPAPAGPAREGEPTPADIGRTCTLCGLSSRPELNGGSGVLISHDAETGRYGVAMAGIEGRPQAIKPLSIQPRNIVVSDATFEAPPLVPLAHVLAPGPRRAGQPLVVLLHGAGANEYDLLGFASHLSEACGGALVAGLRGRIERFEGYAWFEGSSADPLKRALDSGIATAVERVVAFLEDAPRALGTDPRRAYLFGFSQGATVGWSLLATRWPRPDLLAGAACLSGRLLPQMLDAGSPLRARLPLASPTELAARPPFFACHGLEDAMTPIALGRASVALAKKIGLEPALTWMEHNEGHTLPMEMLAATVQTFRRGAARAPS